jgi:hypothetical protein
MVHVLSGIVVGLDEVEVMRSIVMRVEDSHLCKTGLGSLTQPQLRSGKRDLWPLFAASRYSLSEGA